MNNKRLIIGAPQIRYSNDKVIYYAEVKDNGIEKEVYYQYDRKYARYLDDVTSDAFLCGLLYYAMFHGLDIVMEGSVTEQLYYQLTTYLIPVLAKATKKFTCISVTAALNSELIDNAGAVGTGISGGVDSLYTIKKYTTCEQKDYRLTHVMFSDLCTAEFTDAEKNSWKNINIENFKKLSQELALELIIVDTNLDRSFSVGKYYDKQVGILQNAGLSSLKYCGFIYALRKLFKIYYFSSGYEMKDFTVSPKPYDTAYYDLLNMQCLSTKNLFFYSSGAEAGRYDKVKFISDYNIAEKYLSVCNISDSNCGKCEKCVRTLGELYVAGKLDGFVEVLPVDDFKKNISKRYGFILAEAARGHIFERELIDVTREKGIPIPVMSYLYCLINFPVGFLRKILSKSDTVRKFYYKYNIDERIYGIRPRRKTLK
ncbi:hypothetical protein [[Clostridium] symbiosum]|uniref:hypothetical protein n=1 Tax=Clostridium symbiosum TaxID=1512 RepID=UPI00189E396E|nr:hypothetical protein [[Clostridium] symbiosum]